MFCSDRLIKADMLQNKYRDDTAFDGNNLLGICDEELIYQKKNSALVRLGVKTLARLGVSKLSKYLS